ncbi:MAG: hypothetical protein WBV46_22300 [Terriglobales bacterium]
MDSPTEEKIVTEAKPEAAIVAPPLNKFAAKRMANKQRKKRAHRRNLRRSHTKG